MAEAREEPDPMPLLLISVALVVLSLALFVAVPHTLVSSVLVSVVFVVSAGLAIMATIKVLEREERGAPP